MKKTISILLCIVVITTFGLFALASGSDSDDSSEKNQNSESSEKVETEEDDVTKLGNYQVEIMSCRLAKSYDDKDVAIVKFKFTNNDEDASSFSLALKDSAFQNGIGLNHAYMLDDSANYSSDNQLKELKKGSSLEIEVAYELNNKTDDLLIEVEELISFSDDKITKTFTIK